MPSHRGSRRRWAPRALRVERRRYCRCITQSTKGFSPNPIPGADAADLVVLEDHKRATAYVYCAQPNEIGALVGFSPHIDRWYWF